MTTSAQTDNPAWKKLVEQLRATSPKLAALLLELRARGTRERRYRIVDEIARGGMGIVYRVEDRDLDRILAMKVAREPLPISNPKPSQEHHVLFQARFLRELRVTGQLDHPGIVALHDIGIDPHDRLFFTMKLVEGENLATILRSIKRGESDWTLTRVVGTLLRICEAMAHAHSRNIIHRDLKPANIMVGRYGEVYVMDWGLARVLGEDYDESKPTPVMKDDGSPRSEDDEPRTMEGEALGTPSYMPPEQALGAIERVGATADIYALGAILYHALVGGPPYTTTPSGAPLKSDDLLRLVAQGAPTPIEVLNRKAPGELVAIAERAMARHPEHRYASVEDLSKDLGAYLERRVVSAYETGAWAEFRKWYLRNRRLALLAILLAFSIAISTGFIVRNLEVVQNHSIFKDASQRRIQELQNSLDGANTRVTDLAEDLATTTAQRANAENRLAEREQALANEITARSEANERWELADAEITRLKAEIARQRDTEPESPLVDPAAHAALEAEVERLKAELAANPPLERESLDRATRFAKLARELIAIRTDGLALDGPLTAPKATFDAWIARHSAVTKECDAAIAAFGREKSIPEDPLSPDALATALTRLRTDLESVPLVAGAPLPRDIAFHAQQASRLAAIGTSPPEGTVTWTDAQEIVRGIAGFDGVELAVHPDLIPLGADPTSGLLEFWHVPSGEPPRRGPKKDWVISEATGIVFVLVPGGEFKMGAQSSRSSDRGGSNYDPLAAPNEASERGDPVTVDLEPFFVAKYELTNAQFKRLTNRSAPSRFAASETWTFGNTTTTIDGRHPAEGISWEQANELLVRYELALPTEAQWEYAARAAAKRTKAKRADSDAIPWWFGDENDRSKLPRYANFLCGKSGRDLAVPDPEDREIDDEFVLHAPVGSLDPNPFGLFDVLGNVAELCLDPRGDFLSLEPRTDDGLRQDVDPSAVRRRVIRGGDFRSSSYYCRTTARRFVFVDERLETIGVRPVRPLGR